MAVRTIIIERRETNHAIATIYATVFDNGLVDVRRKFHNKWDGRAGTTPDESDMPENRLTVDQHKFLISEIERVHSPECIGQHTSCDQCTDSDNLNVCITEFGAPDYCDNHKEEA